MARIRVISTMSVIIGIFIKSSIAEDTSDCYDDKTYTYNCSRRNLTEVPDGIPEATRYLNLEKNWITELPDGVFQNLHNLEYLNLRYNNISALANDSLQGLHSLRYLDLSRNRVEMGYDSIPKYVFKPVDRLQTLDLRYLRIKPVEYPEDSFSYLRNLKELYLPAVPQKLGHGFAAMKSLERLEFSGRYRCDIGEIKNDTFEALSNSTLKKLSIIKCNVESISEDAFQALPHLDTINLACNEDLQIVNITAALVNLPGSGLDTVILDGISNDLPPYELVPPSFNATSLHNVTRFSVRHINLLTVNPGLLRSLPKLKHLAAGYNTILTTVGLPNSTLEFMQVINDMELETLDISHYGNSIGNSFRKHYCARYLDTEDYFFHPPPYITPPSHTKKHHVNVSTFDSTRPWDFIFRNIPPSLFYLVMDSVQFHFIDLNRKVNDDNNILYFNIASKPIPQMIELEGFEKLQTIDISDCKIDEITSVFFLHTRNLSHVYMSNNNLQSLPAVLFEPLEQLVHLDLSYNRLQYLHPNTFKLQYNVEVINIQSNQLSKINLNLTNLEKIKLMVLSRNSIKYLDKSTITQLDSRFRKNNFTLDLSENPFLCDCQSLEFLQWLKENKINFINKDKYKCIYQDTSVSVPISSVNLEKLRKCCSSKNHTIVIITVSVVGSFLLAIVVIALFCKKVILATPPEVAYREIVNQEVPGT